MADISNYKSKLARQKEIDDVITSIMKLSNEELKEKQEAIENYMNLTMPIIEVLTQKKNDGMELTTEDNELLDNIFKGLKDGADFMLLAKQAIDSRLLNFTDEVYFHLKAEAEKGNIDAQALFKEIQSDRQKMLDNDLIKSQN
jgi:hypothetical protein